MCSGTLDVEPLGEVLVADGVVVDEVAGDDAVDVELVVVDDALLESMATSTRSAREATRMYSFSDFVGISPFETHSSCRARVS